jgi:addiction module HigA family antidote
MAFQDKTLTCVDCGQQFVFTAGEQEFYAQKGFMGEPKKCKSCKAVRKGVSGHGGRRQEGVRAARKLLPVHPGEVLQEEFLKPLGISQYRLAKEISVSPRRVNEIVHGNRAITADTALRLARYFGTTDRFWLNLQARYDLEVERDRLGSRLEREVSVLAGLAPVQPGR